MQISALVVPRVVCNLPSAHIPFDPSWIHLRNLKLADPEFNIPGRVDLLLGVDVCTDVLLKGRRNGPSGAPVAMETVFGCQGIFRFKSCRDCAKGRPRKTY